MSKFIPVFILAIFGFQFASGQLSDEQIQEGYNYYNSRIIHIPSDKSIPTQTLDPNQIEVVCNWMNIDSIIKNLKYIYRDHEKLDTVFNLKQRENIDRDLRSLESIILEKDRLKPIYEIRDFTYFKESFPVIQESKDGGFYAFIYEESKYSRSFGKMRIEKRISGDWKIIGTALIPRYDQKKLKNELINLPEEYQAINSYLAGKDDFVQGRYIQAEHVSRFNNWLEDLDNSNIKPRSGSKERLDLREHFDSKNLVDIAKNLQKGSSEKIERSGLLGELERAPDEGYAGDLDGKNLYSFSKPFIFTSNITCKTYAVFYASKYGGMENGSAAIVIMQKSDGIFKPFFSYMLWIS